MSKSIVITGASGGLGRALAVVLCQAGHRVVGFGRRRSGLDETAYQAGAGFYGLTCDVSQLDQVREAIAAAKAHQGSCEVLINNAALYPRRDTLDETAESFMSTIETNLGGIVACTYAVLPDMMDAGRGRILNVATFADLHPLPASSAYSVSKGAARIWTRALIADLADRFPQIVVGDWMPGMLATDMGVPDGLDPMTSARWGAALSLWDDPDLMGATFEQNREILPPRGIKAKIKDAVLLRRRAPRIITPVS